MPTKVRVNEQITAAELRVIDEGGNNLGVLPRAKALALAAERQLDLIEIAPTANPVVVKLMDYGKFRYLESKKARLARSKSHRTVTKSLQIKIGTGEHDLLVKAVKASGFLEAGHQVKIELFLPGRAKTLNDKFLAERLERLLRLISVPYRLVAPPERSPKGMSVVIERHKHG